MARSVSGMLAALFCAVLASHASTASAQSVCPTAEDLQDGIVLTRTDPFYSNVMTATEGDVAEARIMEDDGVPEAVSSTYAHGLAVRTRVGTNGTLEIVYRDDPAVLDELPRMRSWATSVTLLADGEPRNTGSYTARFLEQIELPIGNCAFQVWRVRTSLRLDGRGPISQDRYFSPDLGLSLATVSLDGNGQPTSNVIYDIIEAK